MKNERTMCHFCNRELSYSGEQADFCELTGFDVCDGCSEEMVISISY